MGWIELGNCGEAKLELSKVSPALAEHPDVLEVRWMILSTERNWTAALDVAQTMVRIDPDRPYGWLHQAYALRRIPNGSVQAAWEALHPTADRFPGEPTIPYNLACYACQMGQPDEARQWLLRACRAGEKQKVKEMALADTDLETLWREIQEW